MVHIKYHELKRLDMKNHIPCTSIMENEWILVDFFCDNLRMDGITCEISPRVSKGLGSWCLNLLIYNIETYRLLCCICFSYGVDWNLDVWILVCVGGNSSKAHLGNPNFFMCKYLGVSSGEQARKIGGWLEGRLIT